MKKQKKNFKTLFLNSPFSKNDFYVKLSFTILFVVIYIIIFLTNHGFIYFESYIYTDSYKYYPFQVHLIDVEHGDALLIRFTNNQTMLIDTGQEQYSDRVLSYIRQYMYIENLNKIDYLVLTHPDSDHVGSAKEVINTFQVDNIYRPKIYSISEKDLPSSTEGYSTDNTLAYDEAIMAGYNKNCNMIYSEKDILLQLGGCKVEFLSPKLSSYSQSNNYSSVIMITYQTKKFLFTGDSETLIENQLIADYGDYLKADVLKVSHHGSNTSTSQEFLEYVKPKYALISCENNSSLFPSTQVKQRLENYGTTILTTAKLGNFVLTVDNQEVIYSVGTKENNLALILSLFVIIVLIMWQNPFKNMKDDLFKIKD